MPDPTSDNLNEELNTAKQAQLENVGALTRAQLTPEAAVAPQGHDVPDHNHAASKRMGDRGNVAGDEHAGHGHDYCPASANLYPVPVFSFALLVAGIALDYYKTGFFTGYVRLVWYGLAFMFVGWKVIKATVLSIPSGNVFYEFLLLALGAHRAVVGTNVLTNNFRETDRAPTLAARDYRYQTHSLFAQNNWRILKNLTLKAGRRPDFERPYGLLVLPRFSPLYKAGEHISLRVGSDFGHKALTIFSSAIKRQAYVNVRSLHALLDGIVGNVALKITL